VQAEENDSTIPSYRKNKSINVDLELGKRIVEGEGEEMEKDVRIVREPEPDENKKVIDESVIDTEKN